MVEKRKIDNGESKPSLLSADEISFPRGGASVLTPLEVKQVANEVTQDLLFEKTSAAEPKQKKAKRAKTSAAAAADTEEDHVTISHLNFKTLAPGSVVLGQVSEISRNEIVLSLPDNLVGFVPITNVSAQLLSELEKLDDSDSEYESDEEEKELPDLVSRFSVGQWLRASVVSNVKASKKQKKRLELSLEPSKTNAGMTEDDLSKNAVVQSAVKSVEDHGFVLDFGMDVDGFLPKKEANGLKLDVGSVVLCAVAKKSGRTVACTTDFNAKSVLSTISSVDAVLPGQLADMLVTQVTPVGLVGKLYGLVDATINLSNLREFDSEQVKHKFGVGSQVRVRVLAMLAEHQAVATVDVAMPQTIEDGLEAFPIGHVFDAVTVVAKDSQYQYVSMGSHYGIVHLSKAGEDTRARVLGYANGYYVLTTDTELINTKYLRAQDIPVGEVISAELVSVSSDKGAVLKFGEFVVVVKPLQLSDVKLVYPERKYKIGSQQKVRVLSIERNRVFGCLKKSIVTTELPLIKTFAEAAQLNDKTLATVDSFKTNGCVVSFLGGLRGFLPNGEISEAFVKKPQDHLRLGQTVTVKVLQAVEESKRLIVSCKVSSSNAVAEQKELIESLVCGRSIVEATVMEKTRDSVVVELNGLRGVVFVGQLSDGNLEQNRALVKKLKVGSTLSGLVIDKDTRTRVFNLTCKESMLKDARSELLPLSYDDVAAAGSRALHGYVKSVSDRGVFVCFGGKLVGLVLPSYAAESRDVDLGAKFLVNQSVTAYLHKTDAENHRFLLSLKRKSEPVAKATTGASAENPVDTTITMLADYTVGRATKCVVQSVKKQQLNVQLADNLQGRIDVSQAFNSIDEIADLAHPLATFTKGQVLEVTVIGSHDARTHKFLPISHRTSKNTILELSLKAHAVEIGSIKVGDKVAAFANNYGQGFVWMTLSPTVKGTLSALECSELPALGSALECTVVSVDTEHGTVSLSARNNGAVQVGDVVPAKIVKISETFLVLDLGRGVQAMAFVTDALDEYTSSLKEKFHPKQIVKATVLKVDDKISVSLRTSPAPTFADLAQGKVVGGFVKAVAAGGVFVYLSNSLQAFVPVSKLTDAYIKDWKKFYKPGQPVLGKIVSCDDESRILVTLKESEVNGELNLLKGYGDIQVGDVFEGSVKNVTEFGVFIKLDGTLNVSGLAYKTEIADKSITDLSSVFGEGDRVKAKVLRVNPEKKQLSLGLKASYFKAEAEAEAESEAEAMDVDESDDDVMDIDDDVSDDDEAVASVAAPAAPLGAGLSTNFDWTASILDMAQDEESSDEEDFTVKKKKKRAVHTEDKTIDINTRAPESVADFERLLMGSPNSSVLWMNYMAFQLQLSEIEKAREIGERALKQINYRQEQEKLNIWIALLNLENSFGSQETVDEVFKRSCQYMDSFVMHQKLLSIYTMSGKNDEALELYKASVKKFGGQRVSIWVSYAAYLIAQGQEASPILAQALQALAKRDHIEVVRKFAQLEFANGDAEKGRSLFEGLLADAPKRIDLWNVYIDQEIKFGTKKKVEDLFERVVARKVTKKQAKFFFNKWLQFEEAKADSKAQEYVTAKAQEYVKKLDQE